MSLDKKDIEKIKIILFSRISIHGPLREELFDHVCCDVEERIKQGKNFDKALHEVLDEINPDKVKKFDIKSIKYQRSNSGDLARNYLKVAIRNLLNNKSFSIINITGLAVGMACCLLILLYVNYELSYDKFHPGYDNIYRLVNSGMARGNEFRKARTPIPWAPSLKDDFSEVENFVRFRTPNSRFMVKYRDNKFYERGFFFTDSTVFEVFGYELIRGNPETVLDKPFSVVITDEMGKKYFGDQDPVGKTIEADLSLELTVTGIMEKPPENSHMHFDFLVSLSSLEDYRDSNGNLVYGNMLTNWIWNSGYTYLLLYPGSDVNEFERKFSNFLEKYAGQNLRNAGLDYKPFLQPITDIHLNSHLENEIEPNGNIIYIYIFSAIAIFVLFIACINFMNLSTARSVERSKEVGMRKVVGALRKQLVYQFLSESILIAFFSSLIAILLIVLLLPAFTNFIGKELIMADLGSWKFITGIILITLMVGVISGSYPALMLSKYNASDVLKNHVRLKSGGGLLRKILVIVQFAISTILIIGIGMVYNQMNYIKNKNVGFTKESIIAIPQPDPDVISRYETLKSLLMDHSNIKGVSAASRIPGEFFPAGFTRKYGAPTDENISIYVASVDFTFPETMEMEIVKGRSFSVDIKSDSANAIILNEAAVRALGLENPLEERIVFGAPNGNPVVGVVKDFHFTSLHDKIEPFAFFVNGYSFLWVLVKVGSTDIQATISDIKDSWEKVNPQHPFDYEFLDEKYAGLYQAETRLTYMLNSFTFIAIFIACLGLYGLVSFTTEQKTKEIGIRKVLGATVPRVVVNLLKEFAILVVLANIIAIPVGYWLTKRWLRNFSYHGEIEIWVFVAAVILTLVIAILTVSFKSIKAAAVNPVKSLKYE